MNYIRADKEGGNKFADFQTPPKHHQNIEGNNNLRGVTDMRGRGLRITRNYGVQMIGRGNVGYGLSDRDEGGEESERSSERWWCPWSLSIREEMIVWALNLSNEITMIFFLFYF